MRALYEFLKFLLKLAVPFFYSNTKIINRERLKFKGPAILITNHPNTLMDPFNVALYMRRQVRFLANASMFNTLFTNWLFSNLYCVPIQRGKDKGAEHVKNEESFDRCDQFLGSGGVLWIAPEGGSEMARKVRPFKTGTARIGFSAENKKDFQLNLAVIPIGITYADPEKFRSEVVVNVGEHYYPKDFQHSYKEDSRQAVRKFTKVLENKVRSLAIHIEDEDRVFVQQVETLFNSEKPLDQEATFFRTQEIVQQLQKVKEGKIAEWEKIKKQTAHYFNQVDENKLTDAYLAQPIKGEGWKVFTLIIGFPVALFGWLNNIIPAFLPAFIAQKMNLYPGYNSTVKIMTGMLIFPLFYYLVYSLSGKYLDGYLPEVYLLFMFLSGLLYLAYEKRFSAFIRQRKVLLFKNRQPELFDRLMKERKEIWAEFSKVLTLK